MKPPCILLLTGTILATTVSLHAQVQSPSPAVTPTPVVYEPLPTLNASVILQPQYFQGPNFTVRNPVPTYSGSNHYTIAPLRRYPDLDLRSLSDLHIDRRTQCATRRWQAHEDILHQAFAGSAKSMNICLELD